MWVRLPWKPRVSRKIRSREIRSALVFEKKEELTTAWKAKEKPSVELLSLGGCRYDNSSSCQRRPQNRGSTSPSKECWRDVPPDRKQETTGVQWWGHKEKWIIPEMKKCHLHGILYAAPMWSVQGWRRHFQSSHCGKDGDLKQPWVGAPQISTDCKRLSHTIIHTVPLRCFTQSKIISFISLVFYQSSPLYYRDMRALSVLLTTIASLLRMMPST